MYVYIHTQYTVTFSSAAMVYTDSLALSLSHTHTQTHQRSRPAELEGIQTVYTDGRITTTKSENASVCADPRAVDLYASVSRYVLPHCMQVSAGLFFHRTKKSVFP